MIYVGSLLRITKVKVKYILVSILLVIIIDSFGLLTHIFETDYEEFTYPLNINMNEILPVLKHGGKPKIEPINDYHYRYKIKCVEKCKLKDENAYSDVRLLYVVKSALGHRKRRDGIRSTWGFENRFSDVVIRRIFIVGSSEDSSLQDEIDEEYSKYKDIVQADFIDSYYNITIKTMMAIKWVVHNCPKARFIMFVDDDFYVSTKNVLKFIRTYHHSSRNLLNMEPLVWSSSLNSSHYSGKNAYVHNDYHQSDFHKSYKLNQIVFDKKNYTQQSSHLNLIPHVRLLQNQGDYNFDERLFTGYVFFSSPMRHKPSKWYITLSEYPFSKYPPYVTAGAYLLSFSALLDLYYTSLYTKHFKFDDIYLGIVAKKAGIIPIHNENFYFWKKSYDKFSYYDVIASHGFHDSHMLQRVWEEQKSLGYA